MLIRLIDLEDGSCVLVNTSIITSVYDCISRSKISFTDSSFIIVQETVNQIYRLSKGYSKDPEPLERVPPSQQRCRK